MYISSSKVSGGKVLGYLITSCVIYTGGAPGMTPLLDAPAEITYFISRE